ncbi:MAG: TonB-dependent receptor [Bacteroidetes bacterium]|nr:TonB-dependent receptor [Bacteroidota bacterium]
MCCWLLWLVLGAGNGLLAQDTLVVWDTLSPIEVTAQLPGRVSRTGSLSLYADEYGHYPAAGLGVEALFQQAEGLYLQDYGGHSGVKTLSMRGFAASHSTLTIEGIPLSNTQLGVVNLANYYSPAFGKVEVSPASANPAQALLAGNADLSLGNCHYRWKAALGTGSWQQRTATLQHNHMDSLTQVYAGYHFTAAQDNYPFVQEEVSGTRQQAEYANHQAWLKARRQVGEHHLVEYVLLGYANAQNIPAPVIKARATGDPSRLMQQNLFHFLRWSWEPRDSLYKAIRPARHHLVLKHQHDNMTVAPGQWYLNRNLHVQYNASGRLLRTTRIIGLYELVGQAATTDLRSDHIARGQQPIPGVSRQEGVLALAQHWGWRLSARTTGLVRFTTRAQVSSDFGWRPGNALHLQVTYGRRRWELAPFVHLTRGWRLPTFNELYFRNFGNSDLSPELARQADAGVLLAVPGPVPLTFKAAVFINHTRDKIISIPTSPVQWSTFSLGDTRSQGVEWSLTLLPLPSLQVYVNHTVMQATDHSVTEGALLPYTPRELLRGGAQWQVRRWAVGAQCGYVSWRYSSLQASRLTYLRPYTLLDTWLRLRQPVRRTTWELSLTARNLLSQSYEVIRAFPMPGRQWMVQLACYW